MKAGMRRNRLASRGELLTTNRVGLEDKESEQFSLCRFPRCE